MKKIAIILIAFVLIISCREPKSNNTVNNDSTTTTENTEIDTLELIKTEASRLRAGGSIKSVEYIDDIVIIEYVKDFAEYKQLQPQSSLTEIDLLAYWESGDAIKKALVDGSVRLMRKLDFLKGAKIKLPYKGKVYIIDVKQDELERFIGSDMETVRNDWDNTFSNPYVYSDSGRDKFFKKFGTIK